MASFSPAAEAVSLTKAKERWQRQSLAKVSGTRKNGLKCHNSGLLPKFYAHRAKRVRLWCGQIATLFSAAYLSYFSSMEMGRCCVCGGRPEEILDSF